MLKCPDLAAEMCRPKKWLSIRRDSCHPLLGCNRQNGDRGLAAAELAFQAANPERSDGNRPQQKLILLSHHILRELNRRLRRNRNGINSGGGVDPIRSRHFKTVPHRQVLRSAVDSNQRIYGDSLSALAL